MRRSLVTPSAVRIGLDPCQGPPACSPRRKRDSFQNPLSEQRNAGIARRHPRPHCRCPPTAPRDSPTSLDPRKMIDVEVDALPTTMLGSTDCAALVAQCCDNARGVWVCEHRITITDAAGTIIESDEETGAADAGISVRTGGTVRYRSNPSPGSGRSRSSVGGSGVFELGD